MNKLLFGFLLSVFSVSVYATPATVSYIVDGDTFAARVNLQDDIKISVRVRIKNIDTPEIHGQCENEIKMAIKAKERLAQLLPIDSEIELSEIKDDKYLGRIDAIVHNTLGMEVGGVLVNEKLARKYNGGHRNPWCSKDEISTEKTSDNKLETVNPNLKMNDWSFF